MTMQNLNDPILNEAWQIIDSHPSLNPAYKQRMAEQLTIRDGYLIELAQYRAGNVPLVADPDEVPADLPRKGK